MIQGAPTALTESDYWDVYWSSLALPSEIQKSHTLYIDELLQIFETYLPRGESLSALEIGGAPGGYLAFLHKTLGYDIAALDYSHVGCQKTAENFALLSINGRVYRGDFFNAAGELPRFDVVFSLGLIEHFVDLQEVVEAHLRYLKPEGVLMLGCPNFLGVNHWIVRRLAPELLAVPQSRGYGPEAVGSARAGVQPYASLLRVHWRLRTFLGWPLRE